MKTTFSTKLITLLLSYIYSVICISKYASV